MPATPHLTVDTILVASHIVVALQQVISRNKNPFSPSVLSISSFQGGFTTNVIPSEVKLMGTFRSMEETWRFQAHKLIHRICKGIGQAMGAEIDVLVDVGYPVVNNDEQLYPVARKRAEEFAGIENIQQPTLILGQIIISTPSLPTKYLWLSSLLGNSVNNSLRYRRTIILSLSFIFPAI